jgi:RimJ/RimL family protein N-acetyltransferase
MIAARCHRPERHPVIVCETERLTLRHLVVDDAAFIVELLNDPDWLRYIGDKGVRTLDDARAYLENGPIAMYARHGFGLFCVELKSNRTPIGMCGLIKRDTLPDVDIGFAFLPRYRARGYAREAAEATLAYGRDAIGLRRVVAITSPDNDASGRLLQAIGLSFECLQQLPGGASPVRYYGWTADGTATDRDALDGTAQPVSA